MFLNHFWAFSPGSLCLVSIVVRSQKLILIQTRPETLKHLKRDKEAEKSSRTPTISALMDQVRSSFQRRGVVVLTLLISSREDSRAAAPPGGAAAVICPDLLRSSRRRPAIPMNESWRWNICRLGARYISAFLSSRPPKAEYWRSL